MPVGLIILMLVVAALPVSRKVTPEEWANELEMVLLGTHDPYGWDDATSIRLADPRLERIRRRLTDHLDPETPEQREELRLIIEDLRTSSEPGKVN